MAAALRFEDCASRLNLVGFFLVAYHLIFGAYGFWLPNDPRGSWSEFVGAWNLLQFGDATTTDERRSVALAEHDRNMRLAAKAALQRPAVRFSGPQAAAVGEGFARYFAKTNVEVWACAILPDHVHLVVGPLHISAEQYVVQLKGAATKRLNEKGIHPFQGNAKCFARGEWKVYLNPGDVSRAIHYVEDNPTKEGKPRQRWSFVTRYTPQG